MPFEPEFGDLMPDSITIEPVASRDKFGSISYGPAVTYQCRINEQVEEVETVAGTQLMAATTIWGRPHATLGIPANIDPESRITLADGSHPAMLRFIVVHDDKGPHHFKIICNRPIRR